MPTRFRTILYIFLLLIVSLKNNAQAYNFRKYQVENGLSNNTVSCLLQDKKGFLWVGTRDGLNRYDGYNFKIFRFEMNNSKSLSGDFVHALTQADNGNIWVGTDKGLFEYDEQEENFHLLSENINYVRDIKLNKDGNLWFIAGKSFYTGTTLYCYNPNSKTTNSYPQSDNSNTTSICITDDNTLWASTSNGFILKYNTASNTFSKFNVFQKTDNSKQKTIEKICSIGKGLILIGTSHQGLILFNTFTKSFENLKIKNADNTPVFVRDILKYSSEEYWIATESGIFIYNIKSGSYLNLRKDYNDPFSISDNSIYSLVKDYEGGVWVGTFFGGLNYYSKQYSSFNKYFPKGNANSLGGNVVREICNDKYGNIWIGTENAGLNKFNPVTSSFIQYLPTGAKGSISYFNIHGLKAIGDELWIGTYEYGLDVMNIKTGRIIRHYSSGTDSNSLKSNFIVTILQTTNKEILIGTYSGLYKFNKETNNFSLVKDIPPDAFVYTLYEDHSGTIWVGTIGDGVYYFNSAKNEKGNFNIKLIKKNNRIRNNVISIFEDSRKVMWLSTEGSGICCYSPKTKVFTNYTTTQGLPSNFIYKVLEDKQKKIWISTSQGLVRFEPGNKTFKIYTTSNGILNSQFNYNSGYIDYGGNLYFGSLGGMIRFNPEDLNENNYIPNLYITNIQVNDKEVNIGDKESPLQKSITNTSAIKLNYNQSYISLDFAALNYSSPETIKYAYTLDGLDKSWTTLKTNRRVYFTNLAPGTYFFRVKILNGNGQVNNKETKLRIEILPPWWTTSWAYMVYFITIAFIVFFVIRSYKNRVKFKNEIKFARHQYEKEKEIMDSKIEFYTSVAHEIRTPLTLIIGPLERIIDETQNIPKIKTSLEFMERNTKQLLNLTNQLLDFRKIEISGFGLGFSKVKISDLVKETFGNFKPLAEKRNLSYQITNPESPVFADVNIEAIQKILNNLFSNAIKYAKRVVTIKLNLPLDQKIFKLEVMNDGYLIPFNLSEKIFEPFYRISETMNENGTGIGLSISRSFAELHQGTLCLKESENGFNIFVLSIPVKRLE